MFTTQSTHRPKMEDVGAECFNQLSLTMASANRHERQLRSFTTYLNEPNVLASYRPTIGSSPLNNPKSAPSLHTSFTTLFDRQSLH
jgi:hypothetical protein